MALGFWKRANEEGKKEGSPREGLSLSERGVKRTFWQFYEKGQQKKGAFLSISVRFESLTETTAAFGGKRGKNVRCEEKRVPSL